MFFEAIRNNKKIAQGVLAVITLPFMLWGSMNLRDSGGGNESIATVGDSKISRNEFLSSLRETRDELRERLAGRDPEILDSLEVRQMVLEGLIQRRLLDQYAAKQRFLISDQQLANVIALVPQLQENGVFSEQRYNQWIAAKGKTKTRFENELRGEMMIQQAIAAVGGASMPGQAAASRWLAAELEEREVSDSMLRAESFLKQVKLTPDAVNAYYDANTAKFQVPEQLRAEYLVLSHDRMTDQVSISEDEIKAWYAKHPYRQAEERQASHILILVGAKAADEEVNAAQAKADEVLALAKKSPKDFAKLAKQHSQDSGSATQGGDLGWFGRGAMVKSFEDAVFSMKEGQVSDLVRSDFGFHIIKLTGIHAERSRPLDEVRNEIVATLKAQAAEKKYIEAAEGFTNTVYEQSDSLAPAAEKYKLTIQTSDWLRKGAGAAGPLGNAKLMAALFSDDAIKEKRNTEAVQIAPKVLVSARVLEYKPATQQPLEMVAPTITAFLTHQEAAKLAAAEGEQKLDQLNNGGKVSVAWSKPRGMKKGMAGELPVQELNAIFRADAEKLPAYAGVSSPNGYTLLRITKVKRFAADGADTPQAGVLRNEYTKQIAGEELAAWLAVLREKYPVKINRTMLESKDQ